MAHVEYGLQSFTARMDAPTGRRTLPLKSVCGSLLLRPASRIIDRRLFLVLATEADRPVERGNSLSCRLHRSSELDTRFKYRARLAAGQHRHHWPGTV